MCVKTDLPQVLALWRTETCLDVSRLNGERWRTLEQGIRAGIPESIRGGFVPNSIGCRVGWHDIFDCYEESVGRFIARAYYSLRLFGWGHPNDWPEFRWQLFASSVIVELKRDAEAFAGPLEECIVFDG
jgi:hypothetical protein